MKHFRFKLIGFGLTVAAGSVIAADDGQQSTKQAEGGKASVVVPVNEKVQRNTEVRFNSKAGSLTQLDPLWFSSGKPTATPALIPPTGSGPIVASALVSESSSGKVVTSGAIASQPIVVPSAVESSRATPPPEPTKRNMLSFKAMGRDSLQLLSARVLFPWMQPIGRGATYPPSGPRVGIVPLGPQSGIAVKAPIGQTPMQLTWTREPNQTELWRQTANSTQQSNLTPPTTAVPNQAVQQVGLTPQQSLTSIVLAQQLPMPLPPVQPTTELPASQLPKAEVNPQPAPVQPTQPATQQLPIPQLPRTEVTPQPIPPQPIAPSQPPMQQLPIPQLPRAEVPPQPIVPNQPPSQQLPMPQLLKAEMAQQPGTVAPQPEPSNMLPLPRTFDMGSQPPAIPRIADNGIPEQPQACVDLPIAPPELMIPAGVEVPGKKGQFGSDPLRLSRDYPSLSDLCGTPIRDRLNAALTNDGDRGGGERGFIEGEYLLWWMRGLTVPVLATSSTSPTGTGFLGSPGTVPILGSGTFLGSAREGLRLRAGYWLDDCNMWEIDGSIFFLGQRDADAAYGSNQFPVLTRPVYSPNTIPGTGTLIGETGEAVSVPGVLSGALTVHAQSTLWGGDVNLARCLFNDCESRTTVFVGYRNLDLVESLTINENIAVIGSGGGRVVVPDPIGTLVNVQDKFATQNYFNGGQIGGTFERRWGRFDLDARASIAFGVTEQELNISGFQNVTLPGQATQTFRGGLLAAGPNLGEFSQNRFSVAPEFTLNAGYWLLPNLKVHLGYNFLYWTNVIRPGEQIDRVVNLSNVPNAPTVGSSSLIRPEALFQQSNMLVHGVQFGIEWRW